jgi:hypothetical protein
VSLEITVPTAASRLMLVLFLAARRSPTLVAAHRSPALVLGQEASALVPFVFVAVSIHTTQSRPGNAASGRARLSYGLQTVLPEPRSWLAPGHTAPGKPAAV